MFKVLPNYEGVIQKFPDWPPGVRTARSLPLDAVVSLLCESL